MTTFLLNEETALDAGALTPSLTLEEQRRLRRVVLTHSHFDHVATLPFLLENLFGGRRAVEIVAPRTVLSPLKRHLFSGALWPDFTKLPSRDRSIVRFREIAENRDFHAGGLQFRPIRVCHIVPTYGYLVATPRASVLFSGDTGPTQKLWEVADRARNLEAIFLEVSFSDAQRDVAQAACHLTPGMLEAEIAKTSREAPVFLYHMKPPSLTAIRREVRALRNPRLRFLRQGQVLEF
jgi:ribonuclease BN (tRNA processing enzyme)